MPKNRFSRHISGIFGQKKSFYKIELRHFLGIAILHLCAKNQQKLTSQSREKLVTDGQTNERTDGQRLIYRTSEVGPKNKLRKLKHALNPKKSRVFNLCNILIKNEKIHLVGPLVHCISKFLTQFLHIPMNSNYLKNFQSKKSLFKYN